MITAIPMGMMKKLAAKDSRLHGISIAEDIMREIGLSRLYMPDISISRDSGFFGMAALPVLLVYGINDTKCIIKCQAYCNYSLL